MQNDTKSPISNFEFKGDTVFSYYANTNFEVLVKRTFFQYFCADFLSVNGFIDKLARNAQKTFSMPQNPSNKVKSPPGLILHC